MKKVVWMLWVVLIGFDGCLSGQCLNWLGFEWLSEAINDFVAYVETMPKVRKNLVWSRKFLIDLHPSQQQTQWLYWFATERCFPVGLIFERFFWLSFEGKKVSGFVRIDWSFKIGVYIHNDHFISLPTG